MDDEMTNADLFTNDELHEMDQADEARMDAADEAAQADAEAQED